ncbi:hypothetical protein [Psychromonas sp. KJ10-2]|uniref:hypothetical protein n=1 Tax=Psychromonas sp. KJ10-2 TaxID=3391822 RepID=UPI0039B524ED
MKNKHISAWSYNTSRHSVEQSSVSHCEINANEILLENEIAGINPVDWKFIQIRLTGKTGTRQESMGLVEL